MIDTLEMTEENAKCERFSDEAQFREAECAVREGDENSKKRVAFFMLSGRGGVEVNAKGAVALLEELEKKGDAEAMWMLGLCSECGLGTEKDSKRAEHLFMQSRDKGNEIGRLLLEKSRNRTGNDVFDLRGMSCILLFGVSLHEDLLL